MSDIEFKYIKSRPIRWTFQPKKIRRVIEKELEGRTLNLFAGKTKLNHNDEIIRNDINKDRDTDYHFDALYVDKYLGSERFNTIILDPPWSIRKGREKYNGKYKGKFTIIKEKISPLLEQGGKVITCGYSSVGMSQKRGYNKEKIYLICQGGDHKDYIILVERKTTDSIDNFI